MVAVERVGMNGCVWVDKENAKEGGFGERNGAGRGDGERGSGVTRS